MMKPRKGGSFMKEGDESFLEISQEPRAEGPFLALKLGRTNGFGEGAEGKTPCLRRNRSVTFSHLPRSANRTSLSVAVLVLQAGWPSIFPGSVPLARAPSSAAPVSTGAA